MKPSSCLLTAGIPAQSAVAQVRVPPNFEIGAKFQIVIQETIDITAPIAPADAVVWDLDLYHVARTPGIVDYLRANNPDVILMCYFNAGLAQVSDCDYDTRWVGSGLLGNPYSPDHPDFSDERWINIRNQTARDWVKRRITLARDVGCDAVDPDNMDGYLLDRGGANVTGWDLSEDDFVAFVAELAAHAHSLATPRGHAMLIGQKNAAAIVDRLEPLLDFAVLEDCKMLNYGGDYSFCADFQAYIANGKPVFSIEYPSTLGVSGGCRSRGASDEQYEASCDSTAGNAGFSTVLKLKGGDGELNGCTQYCDGGEPETGVVVTGTDTSLDGAECPANAE